MVLDAGLAEDAFVTGYHIKPGDRRIVHHVVLYAAATAEAKAAAAEADALSSGLGYPCPTMPAGTTSLGGWVPGMDVHTFTDGTGVPLQAGRALFIQIHYNIAGGAYPDRTAVDLQLELPRTATGGPLSAAPG